MDQFRRLEPTPSALRSGRLTLTIVAVALVVLVASWLIAPESVDTASLAITAAAAVTRVGHVIPYIGQPTLTRYRAGPRGDERRDLGRLWLLIASPFPAGS